MIFRGISDIIRKHIARDLTDLYASRWLNLKQGCGFLSARPELIS